MNGVLQLAEIRPDTLAGRLAAHAEIQERLRQEVGELKGKRLKASRRLLDRLDLPSTDRPDADTVTVNEVLVRNRLLRMQGSTKLLEPDRRRDLLIVLMFGTRGKLPRDTLERAAAILKLRGAKQDVQDVCKVFSGFRHVFND